MLNRIGVRLMGAIGVVVLLAIVSVTAPLAWRARQADWRSLNEQLEGSAWALSVAATPSVARLVTGEDPWTISPPNGLAGPYHPWPLVLPRRR